jgi:hypothetical protein
MNDEPTSILDNPEEAYKVLKPLVQTGFRGLVQWLLVRGPKRLRIASLISLLICLLCTYWWWTSTSSIETNLLNSLSTESEATAQSFKGLEAFVLSAVAVDLQKSLNGKTINPSFAAAVLNFRQKAQGFSLARSGPAQDHFLVIPTGDNAPVPSKYVTDVLQNNRHNPTGFLFVPAIVVRPQSASDDDLVSTLKKSSALYADIRLSEELAVHLCTLNDKNVFVGTDNLINPQPIQSYYLSSSGMIRLCELNAGTQAGSSQEQLDFYKDQFEAISFFADRSYFSGTFHQKQDQELVDDPQKPINRFFHTTAPYLDAGGNGIVLTLCKDIIDNATNQSILCVDLPLTISVKDKIREKMKALGGDITETHCHQPAQGGHLNCDNLDPVSQQAVREVADRFFSRVDTGDTVAMRAALTNFFGRIQIVNTPVSSQSNLWNGFKHYVGAAKSLEYTLAFTVPVGRQSGEGQLLLCKIDLAAADFIRFVKSSLAVGSFLCFLVFMFITLADYGVRLNEQELAFASVGRVLQDAPVCYVRLDEDDRFVDFNLKFAQQIGFIDLREAKDFLKGRTFESLIVNPTEQAAYKKLTATRHKITSEKPEPYVVTLSAKPERKVTFEVFGARVPSPLNPRSARPRTFGILLETGPKVRPFTEPHKSA